jgi:hypothetical protein
MSNGGCNSEGSSKRVLVVLTGSGGISHAGGGGGGGAIAASPSGMPPITVSATVTGGSEGGTLSGHTSGSGTGLLAVVGVGAATPVASGVGPVEVRAPGVICPASIRSEEGASGTGVGFWVTVGVSSVCIASVASPRGSPTFVTGVTVFQLDSETWLSVDPVAFDSASC